MMIIWRIRRILQLLNFHLCRLRTRRNQLWTLLQHLQHFHRIEQTQKSAAYLSSNRPLHCIAIQQRTVTRRICTRWTIFHRIREPFISLHTTTVRRTSVRDLIQRRIFLSIFVHPIQDLILIWHRQLHHHHRGRDIHCQRRRPLRFTWPRRHLLSVRHRHPLQQRRPTIIQLNNIRKCIRVNGIHIQHHNKHRMAHSSMAIRNKNYLYEKKRKKSWLFLFLFLI